MTNENQNEKEKISFNYSKWERTKCPHGRFYYNRWRWKEGLTISDSEPEFSGNKCKLCKKEREQ